jgi:hypothetical protein
MKSKSLSSLNFHVIVSPGPERTISTVYLDNIAHGTAICCINHIILQNYNSTLLRQLGYKHTFSQNAVSTKNCLSLYFSNDVTCLRVGLSGVGQVFCIGGLRQIAVL